MPPRPPTSTLFPYTTLFRSAGEQLPVPVLEEWRARIGLDVYEGLGMTECSYYLCETRSRPIRPGSAGFADRKSTRLNSSHMSISYAVFCLKKKKKKKKNRNS